MRVKKKNAHISHTGSRKHENISYATLKHKNEKKFSNFIALRYREKSKIQSKNPSKKGEKN